MNFTITEERQIILDEAIDLWITKHPTISSRQVEAFKMKKELENLKRLRRF